MALPLTGQNFIVEPDDGSQSGRPREPGDVLPLLVALQNLKGDGTGELLVDASLKVGPTLLRSVLQTEEPATVQDRKNRHLVLSAVVGHAIRRDDDLPDLGTLQLWDDPTSVREHRQRPHLVH